MGVAEPALERAALEYCGGARHFIEPVDNQGGLADRERSRGTDLHTLIHRQAALVARRLDFPQGLDEIIPGRGKNRIRFGNGHLG